MIEVRAEADSVRELGVPSHGGVVAEIYGVEYRNSWTSWVGRVVVLVAEAEESMAVLVRKNPCIERYPRGKNATQVDSPGSVDWSASRALWQPTDVAILPGAR